MGAVELPYVNSFRDRHGKWRYYYRRSGLRLPLEGTPGSIEFATSYERIQASFEMPAPTRPAVGTFGALVVEYYGAPEFTQLRETTRAIYRGHIDDMKGKWSSIKIEGITRRVVKAYRDKMAATPQKANQALRVLKTLLSYAVENEWLEMNPAHGVKSLKVESDGWKQWPPEALESFAKNSIGVARIAFFLALFTGQRRGDVLAMRWDAIRNDGIALRQIKTGAELWVPLHPILKRELAKVERKGLTILQKTNGAPYSEDGFGSIWNRAQHACGCAGMPFHGLRKNATAMLFEAGCTPQQVQAITGHATLAMVSLYGKGANQRRLAVEAMRLVVENENEQSGDDPP